MLDVVSAGLGAIWLYSGVTFLRLAPLSNWLRVRVIALVATVGAGGALWDTVMRADDSNISTALHGAVAFLVASGFTAVVISITWVIFNTEVLNRKPVKSYDAPKVALYSLASVGLGFVILGILIDEPRIVVLGVIVGVILPIALVVARDILGAALNIMLLAVEAVDADPVRKRRAEQDPLLALILGAFRTFDGESRK